MKIALRITLLLSAVLALSACGGGGDEPPVIPDRDGFDAAVQRYLSGRSMDLSIDEYRSFELAADGNSATAVIALAHGGEGYANLRVRYEFTFQKVNDRWQATAHRPVKE